MNATDLIKSFMQQAKWSQHINDGKPVSGSKWLTVKQESFLWSLCKKEDPKGIDFFDAFTWEVDGYKVRLGDKMPNGCKTMFFTQIAEEKPTLTDEEQQLINEYRMARGY